MKRVAVVVIRVAIPAIVLLFIVAYLGRETDYELLTAVPPQVVGEWVKQFYLEPGDLPLLGSEEQETMIIHPKRLRIERGDGYSLDEPIRRVHCFANGDIIIFYGDADEHRTAKFRRVLRFTPTGLLRVSDLVWNGITGEGETDKEFVDGTYGARSGKGDITDNP